MLYVEDKGSIKSVFQKNNTAIFGLCQNLMLNTVMNNGLVCAGMLYRVSVAGERELLKSIPELFPLSRCSLVTAARES